jgi:hypothetical protein
MLYLFLKILIHFSKLLFGKFVPKEVIIIYESTQNTEVFLY